MRILEVRELEFQTLVTYLCNPTFFLCVFLSGRSFSFQWLKGVAFRKYKVFTMNTTTAGVWRFLVKQRSCYDLAFPYECVTTFAIEYKTTDSTINNIYMED